LKRISLLDDETIETTMDVDVDELCTITVANNPSIRPAIGLERIALSVNALPVILPNYNLKKINQ
jgi:hypothetical protein